MELKFGVTARLPVIVRDALYGLCLKTILISRQKLALFESQISSLFLHEARFPQQKSLGMILEAHVGGFCDVANYLTHRIHRSCHDGPRTGPLARRALV